MVANKEGLATQENQGMLDLDGSRRADEAEIKLTSEMKRYTRRFTADEAAHENEIKTGSA